jgi:hypothetical protein
MGRKEFNEKLEEYSLKKFEILRLMGKQQFKHQEKVKIINQIDAEILHLKLLQ